ncbi:PREDICTED: uncharacterized protein LOC104737410 [Camelina sativa]|uniref:Uncharacterized protein LOC104737410 n=1 Tax=Camelina sativa TaxID=90675 RepID=A0ABM0VGP4_CAMSA|nr:PREDICTED: uncharacterized protein LOC104737410 [Camelina sativa]
MGSMEAVEEDSVGENEEGSDEETKFAEPEAKIDMLEALEWDVDSFNGLEYYSSPDTDYSSDEEQPYPDMEKANKHYRIYKRQIIESKSLAYFITTRASSHRLAWNLMKRLLVKGKIWCMSVSKNIINIRI